MPSSIKPGSQVTVVEGANRGESGKVSSVFRRYEDGTTRKLVTFENRKGKKITTRLTWVREIA